MGRIERPFINGWIIALLLAPLFPVAVVLAIVRFVKHRNYTPLRIMDWKLCGNIFLTFFSMLTLSFLLTLPEEGSSMVPAYIVFVVLFLLPALYFYYRARRLNKAMTERFGQYSSMIYNERIRSIAQMADRLHVRLDVAANELLYMEMTRRIPDMYVDSYNYSIEFIDDEEPETHISIAVGAGVTVGGAAYAARQPEAGPKTVECPSCGAKTLLQPGESKECEYCLSFIQYS